MRVGLDWRRLRAVVLQSDDWGLCAWVPDDRAHRALAGQPAFRTVPGRAYGRSTLETAADVRAIAHTLGAARGADGFAAVLQANTIVANPDHEAFQSPEFASDLLPLRVHPALPARWERPGLWEAVREAERTGVWWAELHGLHHLPAHAWREALRRGEEDARRAFQHASPICRAVEASGEYDASEPQATRAADLRAAIEHFERLFGRRPTSFCPPDYRFDAWLEQEATALGLTTWQGKPEQHGRSFARLRRWAARWRFPRLDGERFLLPPRIAFEPRGESRPRGRVGLDAAIVRVRAAWGRGQPAIISTHRLNYAHLDSAWSEAGREAFGTLLRLLADEGARFLTDMEVRQLVERSWSVRASRDGALLRHHGEPHTPLRFPMPAGVRAARFEGPHDDPAAMLQSEPGSAEARVGAGEYRIAWERA